jgi:hypothetical protein
MSAPWHPSATNRYLCNRQRFIESMARGLELKEENNFDFCGIVACKKHCNTAVGAGARKGTRQLNFPNIVLLLLDWAGAIPSELPAISR